MADPYRYRNPDGTLRLDELLGEKHVRHYTSILNSSNEQFRAMQLAMAAGYAPDLREQDDRGTPWRRQARGSLYTDDGWLMLPEGAGPRLASSCLDLAVHPEVCWDVCGYYRRLGVHWKATRKQIRQAYMARDPQQENGDLFYAMSQLLDPLIRRAYDLMPLGGLFLGDRDVREQIERQAALEASRINAEAWWDDERTDQEKVLRGWGYDKGVSAEEARERLGAQNTQPFRYGTSSDELGSSRSVWERSWAYYRLTDPYDDGDAPLRPAAVLEQWQALVAQALEALGVRISFGVGIWPGHGHKLWQDSNKSCIFFTDGETAQEMACEAAKEYVARFHKRKRALCPSSKRDSKLRKRSPRRSPRTGRGRSASSHWPSRTATSTTCGS